MSTGPAFLSVLFVCFNQQDTVAAALQSILDQDWCNLEIVVSDDASTDGTFAVIEALLQGYRGPHRLVVNRNVTNLGVGGNINQAVSLSHGDLLVIAAGDDVSLPQRCAHLAEAWEHSGRRLDLIASPLIDMDAHGGLHGVIRPARLQDLSTPDLWLTRRPHVVGAAQAWTRRAYEHFGPLPKGVVAEDLIMVFRAVCLGGALTLDKPLVQYRRGGLSGRVRSLSAADVTRRLLSNNRHALVESQVLCADADKAGCSTAVRSWFARELGRERFIHDLFANESWRVRLQLAMQSREPDWTQRLRLFVYAACPQLLAPFFALKRAVYRFK